MVDPTIRMPNSGHRLRRRSAARQSLAVLLATTVVGVVWAHMRVTGHLDWRVEQRMD